jgi:hypothetical protein
MSCDNMMSVNVNEQTIIYEHTKNMHLLINAAESTETTIMARKRLCHIEGDRMPQRPLPEVEVHNGLHRMNSNGKGIYNTKFTLSSSQSQQTTTNVNIPGKISRLNERRDEIIEDDDDDE